MKLGISGVHGSGKTTLINCLAEEEGFKHFKKLESPSSIAKRLGFSINEQGNDATQIFVANQLVVNSSIEDNVIGDRTILDCLAYTRYLYKKSLISPSTLSYVEKLFEKSVSNWDVLLYLKPLPLVEDGKRSLDTTFHKEVLVEFEALVKECHLHILPIYIIGDGSVAQRIEQVLYSCSILQ